MTNNISYIIGFRAISKEQIAGLFFVLKKLRHYFSNLEIIVVEQDKEQQMQFHADLNIKHLFFEDTGLYNRAKSFNLGVKHSNKNAFIFADNGIFLEKKDFLTLFEATILFEAIAANKIEEINVAISKDNPEAIKILNKIPSINSFTSGLIALTRHAYEKIGGWDEQFENNRMGNSAMDHIIYQKLISKTFSFKQYRLEFTQSIANKNQQNHNFSEIVTTLHGSALNRYINSLQQKNEILQTAVEQHQYFSKQTYHLSSKKKLNFVLAITTYNRLDYLQVLLDSFFKTRDSEINWQIIVADDGSKDGTLNYLENLQKQFSIIIIRNQQVDIQRQTNTILKTLETMDFDLCFKCDDDVAFIKSGWDWKYLETIQQTGYQHLVFYDKRWRPHINLEQAIRYGNLASNCLPKNIQGAFYTLTPEIIQHVGFFDEQQIGRRGLGHVDYTFRCCRLGYNILAHPFDLADSNDFIHLQGAGNYISAISSKYKSFFNTKEAEEFERNLIQFSRTYIPYNENYFSLGEITEMEQQISNKIEKPTVIKYPKADASFYPKRGFSGLLGFLLKQFYNLCIDLRLYFIPKGIKFFGRILNKFSIDLIDIDK